MMIKKALIHFIDFHQGKVNAMGHIIGFSLLFYSIYQLDWKLFAISLVMIEFGHVYNHFVGIKPYESNLKVNIWRVSIFVLVVLLFYLCTRLFVF